MQGPKLRIGLFKNDSVVLKKGQKFKFDMEDKLGDETRVTLPHKEIFEALKKGDTLLVNDGNIILNVLKCDKKSAVTEVVVGGVISGHKGVNLPNSSLNISPLTPKDLDDLDFALKLGVDCVCLSFVQRASDVKEARKIIKDKAWIISKLEKPQVMNDLDGIIAASDMIMVARGDLGVECPIVTVPVLQKKIVAKCRACGKPVIVATQMLESMISAPIPTRAEVSDVATGVILGADAVMLSDETANGKYPIETIREMKKVILYTQNHTRIMTLDTLPTGSFKNYDAIAHAAVEVAEAVNADVIVAATKTGATAAAIAAQRPNMPIVSITSDARVAGQLALTYANSAFVREYDENYAIDAVQDLKLQGYLKTPEGKDYLTAVIVSGLRDAAGGTNQIQIRRI
jgi:pyruvate kinase